jgi:hypothetical protein
LVVAVEVDVEMLDIHSLNQFLKTIMVVFLVMLLEDLLPQIMLDRVVEVDKEIVEFLEMVLDKVVPLVVMAEVDVIQLILVPLVEAAEVDSVVMHLILD